jgi:hypothetical protein
MSEQKKYPKRPEEKKGNSRDKDSANKAEEYISDHPNKKEGSSIKHEVNYDKIKGIDQKEKK